MTAEYGYYSDGRQRPMFPHSVDSTIMSTFRSCPQKAFQQYVEHWKPKQTSVHLVAGGAFASGIEAARKAFYVQGLSPADAEGAGLAALITHYGDFIPPEGSAKTLERMCGALEFYFFHYPLGADGANPITLQSGQRGIEFSFAEPLDIRHPVTGDPILYTGRSDMLAERAGGIYVYDEKTTTSLGMQWANQWEMRSQFTGYEWAAGRQGIKTAGSIIRGVSILKTKYDTLEVATYRSKHEVERFESQLVRDVQRMVRAWEDGYWDYSLDGGCTEYGGCSLVKVCKSPDPESWLPVYFAQRVWDPLARKELTVNEHEAAWGYKRDIPLAECAGSIADGQGAQLQDALDELLAAGIVS